MEITQAIITINLILSISIHLINPTTTTLSTISNMIKAYQGTTKLDLRTQPMLQTIVLNDSADILRELDFSGIDVSGLYDWTYVRLAFQIYLDNSGLFVLCK